MSEFAYPLDGEQNYTAAQAGAYNGSRGSGVYSGEGNLAVSVTGAKQLTLAPGQAWFTTDSFWGKTYVNTSDINFTLPTADGALDMICRLIVRWNKTANTCKAIMLEGTPASTPIAPAVLQTNEQYDLVLADYLMVHGETEATAANLTDQRLNETLCGLMRDAVERIPTAALEAQFHADLNTLEQELTDVEAGTAFDFKPVRVENVSIAAAAFVDFTPAVGSEEAALFSLGYVKRATVAVTGVLATMTPYVTFSLPSISAAGADIANQVSCYAGGIYLYASGVPGDAVTALTIECRKAVA